MVENARTGAPMQIRSRLAWPDAARGLAIILVVLHHAVQDTVGAGLAAPDWLVATEFVRTMRMPLFFTAAGLFAGKWAIAPWRAVLTHKVLLFVWVFVLWSALSWAVAALLPGGAARTSLPGLLEQLVWPVVGWFLVTLAVFFVLAKALHRVDRRLQLVGAAVVSIVWFSGWVGFGNRAWDGVFEYFVFFLAGCIGRQAIIGGVEGSRWWWGILVVAMWPSAYFTVLVSGAGDVPGVQFGLRVLGVAAGIAIAVTLAGWVSLRALGRNTLPIYLTHKLWLAAFIPVIVKFSLVDDAPASEVWLPAVLGAAALGGSLVVAVAARWIHAGWLFATPAWLHRLAGGTPRTSTLRQAQ